MARLVNSGKTPPPLTNEKSYRTPKQSDDFDWSFYLNRNEMLEWQGRPSRGFRISPANIFGIVFMIFWTGFAVFWTSQAAKASFQFSMFGWLFIGIGTFNLLKLILGDTIKSYRSHYALTDKRALISENGTLHSIALHVGSNFEIQHHKNSESIFFDQFNTGGGLFNMNFNSRKKTTKKLGFQWLDDGRDVYQKLLQIVEDLK